MYSVPSIYTSFDLGFAGAAKEEENTGGARGVSNLPLIPSLSTTAPSCNPTFLPYSPTASFSVPSYNPTFPSYSPTASFSVPSYSPTVPSSSILPSTSEWDDEYPNTFSSFYFILFVLFFVFLFVLFGFIFET
jgi:hypothetical protein